jgi:hypothetical protein
MSLIKNKQAGFSHTMAIIAIVVVFGAVGTFMLVRSKATTSGCIGSSYRERKMNNNCVKQIQIMVNYFNYPSHIDEDGDFGPATKTAVKKFQSNYGLSNDADGIVGPNTWKKLCTSTNSKATLTLTKNLLAAKGVVKCQGYSSNTVTTPTAPARRGDTER